MPGTYLDPRDREHAESLPAGGRAVVVATVERFRRPDRLAAGNPLPQLELTRLDDGSRVPVRALVEERPLVIVFGSFT